MIDMTAGMSDVSGCAKLLFRRRYDKAIGCVDAWMHERISKAEAHSPPRFTEGA